MTEGNHEAGATDVTVRHVRRTRRICVHNATEIGALVRLARQRLGMSQTDAAICCGVGRRFLVELENGKPTVQLDKMLVVLDALGIGLMVRGPGVSFTAEELAQAPSSASPKIRRTSGRRSFRRASIVRSAPMRPRSRTAAARRAPSP